MWLSLVSYMIINVSINIQPYSAMFTCRDEALIRELRNHLMDYTASCNRMFVVLITSSVYLEIIVVFLSII
jgi:hypothetical protein